VRAGQSAWGFVSSAEIARTVQRLADDLASGEWDRRYGRLRSEPFFLGALRLLVGHP
jgi:hypothetical protein